MKLICLNIWGGRAGKDPLLAFFEKYRDEADIFCLQEVWASDYADFQGVPAGGVPLDNSGVVPESYQHIGSVLPGFHGYFHPHFLDHYGLASFVKDGIAVAADGEVYVHHEKGYVPQDDLGKHARSIQFLTLDVPGGPVTVVNFHGLWNGKGKSDCPERLEQSARILAFLRTLDHPFVLVGDFNLTPETESLRMLEDAGMRNLISEYGITSTRTSFYTKDQKFADYALVSEGVEVRDFRVLPDEVSDHAALFLDFSRA